MSEHISKKIDQVRKLLELSERNPSKNEREAAKVAALRIMETYRISQAQLEAAGQIQSEPMVCKVIAKFGNRTEWRETILDGLMRAYGCDYYWMRTYQRHEFGKRVRTMTYTVVGRSSDVDIIEYMFTYLCREGEGLAKSENPGEGPGWSKSYLSGFALEINRKLQFVKEEQKQKHSASTSAMVLLDNRQQEAKAYMNANVKGLTDSTSLHGGRSSADAFHEGRIAGQKTNIHHGLNKATTPKKLGQ